MKLSAVGRMDDAALQAVVQCKRRPNGHESHKGIILFDQASPCAGVGA